MADDNNKTEAEDKAKGKKAKTPMVPDDELYPGYPIVVWMGREGDLEPFPGELESKHYTGDWRGNYRRNGILCPLPTAYQAKGDIPAYGYWTTIDAWAEWDRINGEKHEEARNVAAKTAAVDANDARAYEEAKRKKKADEKMRQQADESKIGSDGRLGVKQVIATGPGLR